jgi:hypothetical protein
MATDKNKDEFGQRKDFRRQHLKNKNLDKKQLYDDLSIPKTKKENKKRIEDMRQGELWEDWEEYGQ